MSIRQVVATLVYLVENSKSACDKILQFHQKSQLSYGYKFSLFTSAVNAMFSTIEYDLSQASIRAQHCKTIADLSVGHYMYECFTIEHC